ncbi:uncharacterized protein LOC110017974 [Phalaenopsis equestris]|uniref:uncharacterized protein LOC110017974 n=1 Tax=Phalaenopsis equestris TaxID=78828 RepID=UPI0009E4E7FA|nr:uncharacterized protein LOC110017974 [Phalaenopsis equestris]XP_020570826.1 uncharacterized protein LOC110017974 [Phalaenopsis equestris]XP_020570827.1 uncharacterized protein LOC110017974 [Phalaenopsis equestris]XP_020570828.1 uncharacterized protein LOC110017974 [Phalaenopsis equestris]
MEERRLPTREDVVKKIKDDGDFDTLRLKIIRAVKENEELRKSIIDQVKRSDILNKDGSEDMKPRQLSDAIYEELGRKITGQISDEIWKTIRLNESIKDDIKGTVEHVINKMVNPMPQTSLGSNPSPTQENQIIGREANGIIKTSIITPASEANISNSNKTYEPPGFGSGDADNGESKNSDLQENEQRAGLIQNPQELLKPIEDVECGFGSSGGGGGGSGEVDDDTDLPPGFN